MVVLDAADTLELDDRFLSSIDGFLAGIQGSNLNNFKNGWSSFHEAGTLDSDSSLQAVGLSECMQLLCDTFMNLEVKVQDHAEEMGQKLHALPLDDADELKLDIPSPSKSRSASPSPPSRSSSPTLICDTTPPLPAYIPPSYSWLLSNLHNPYPSTAVRDGFASSTSTSRHLIDRWFNDTRRKIGWTALLSNTHSSSVDEDARRRRSRVEETTNTDSALGIEPEESFHFAVLRSTAEALYRDKLQPSDLAVKVTSQVVQYTPELGEKAKAIREEQRKRKRRRRPENDEDTDDEDEEEQVKRRRLSTSPSPLSLNASQSSLDSPPPYTPKDSVSINNTTSSLKRKRAVSSSDIDTFADADEPPSSANKRLRTTVNLAGFRSVSDPTSFVSHLNNSSEASLTPAPMTFTGFSLPILNTWLDNGDFADPFDAQFKPWGGVDPVVAADSPDASHLSVFQSLSPSASSSYSTASSSPRTPALSVSGSFTDLSEDEAFPTPADILNNASHFKGFAPSSTDTDFSSFASLPLPSMKLTLDTLANFSQLSEFADLDADAFDLSSHDAFDPSVFHDSPEFDFGSPNDNDNGKENTSLGLHFGSSNIANLDPYADANAGANASLDSMLARWSGPTPTRRREYLKDLIL
ncbi:hypothetical protein BDP27DRAFT_1315954 [Rhodocollybia butyracea]|uniref:KN homeodomain domain-containing protein n=1 Tax=Rhodocollybia butyracea TaxID=206335 RepID=A0A9P5Q3G9_9AGAR|nr:hypothetical protein BDP27DRAFT_1315954 [Rhodocollybia butyracea]